MTNESASLDAGSPHQGQASVGEAASRQRQSYRDIIKSSLLIGGSSATNVLVSIVRTKILAVLLGPGGYAIVGTYWQIVDLTRTVAQMGINSSGVRQIADALASSNEARVARTAQILRRVCVVSAIAGAVLLVGGGGLISQFSFGNDAHASHIMWLSLAAFFAILSGGQGALLQGVRRIGDLAKLTVIGGLLGTLASIVSVYFYGNAGIVPSVILTAACTTVVAWYLSRKICFAKTPLSFSEFREGASELLKLGLAFMGSAVLTQVSAYLVRIIAVRKAGLNDAGMYQAAWAIGGMYTTFILSALGTDFYPRLVSVASNHKLCNRLVNEQVLVSGLFALPGVLATIALAPLVINVFYSSEFNGAIDILRWICLGMMLRVWIYPLGYILVAKNKRCLFLTIDATWSVLSVVLAWFCLSAFGINGAGMAYFASYVCHTLFVWIAVRRITGFRWTSTNLRIAIFSSVAIGVTFVGVGTLPTAAGIVLGCLVTLVCAMLAMHILVSLSAPDRVPKFVTRLISALPFFFKRFGFVQRAAEKPSSPP
ncbi:O-antigen translocase [Azohydromonas australica]|uniref:O-antigen translocase n=1 Tax=Azohydromonas australica TaxID=364039 RepID=UPI000405FF2A|nr:O-antigen translocase [Azohydromonas australica]